MWIENIICLENDWRTLLGLQVKHHITETCWTKSFLNTEWTMQQWYEHGNKILHAKEDSYIPKPTLSNKSVSFCCENAFRKWISEEKLFQNDNISFILGMKSYNLCSFCFDNEILLCFLFVDTNSQNYCPKEMLVKSPTKIFSVLSQTRSFFVCFKFENSFLHNLLVMSNH